MKLKLKLFAFAVTAMMICAPANAAPLAYNFSGIGSYFQQSGRFANEPILVADGYAYGSFGFAPNLATSDGNGGLTVTGIGSSSGSYTTNYTANVSEDRLSLAMSSNYMLLSSNVLIDVWFEYGYLSGVFPTTIDFTRAISSHFEWQQRVHVGSGGQAMWGNGQLTSLSVGQVSPVVAFVANPSTTPMPAVPEPSTWAMMLFGFGAIGVAMRRSRRRISSRFGVPSFRET